MIRVYNTLMIWGAINFIEVFVATSLGINPIIVTCIFLTGFMLILFIGLIYAYRATWRKIKK